MKPEGQGYVSDSRVKRAIERRAVDVAIKFYAELYGIDAVTYTGDDKPYDLEVSTDIGLRRVEVKGTTDYPFVDLFVVFDIGFERLADGNALGSGGAIKVWEKWNPNDSSLKATRYRHTLPLIGYSQFDVD